MLSRWGTRGLAGMGLGLALMMPATRMLNAQQYHGLPQVDMTPPVVQNDPSLTMSTPEGRALIAKRIKALNTMRQQALVSDTDKLLKLAQELNAEVCRSHRGKLTPDELHKIAEIQKLAHSVKDEMTMVVGGAIPSLDATPPPPPTLPFSN